MLVLLEKTHALVVQERLSENDLKPDNYIQIKDRTSNYQNPKSCHHSIATLVNVENLDKVQVEAVKHG